MNSTCVARTGDLGTYHKNRKKSVCFSKSLFCSHPFLFFSLHIPQSYIIQQLLHARRHPQTSQRINGMGKIVCIPQRDDVVGPKCEFQCETSLEAFLLMSSIATPVVLWGYPNALSAGGLNMLKSQHASAHTAANACSMHLVIDSSIPSQNTLVGMAKHWWLYVKFSTCRPHHVAQGPHIRWWRDKPSHEFFKICHRECIISKNEDTSQ